MKTTFLLRATLLAGLALPGLVQAATVHYVGRDGNWFDSGNWSPRQVPGPGDDVMIDQHDDVVIDPARGGTSVLIRDLYVKNLGRLTALPGVVIESRNEWVGPGARVVLRGAAAFGERAQVGDAGEDPQLAVGGYGGGGILVNPSTKSHRDVILKTSSHLDLGIGGLQPARLTFDAAGAPQLSAGRGHYGTLNVETVQLAGELRLSAYYGFDPLPGDRYVFLRSSQRTFGQFDRLPQGARVACTQAGIPLHIDYRAGDGDDVELIARSADAAACRSAPVVRIVTEDPLGAP